MVDFEGTGISAGGGWPNLWCAYGLNVSNAKHILDAIISGGAICKDWRVNLERLWHEKDWDFQDDFETHLNRFEAHLDVAEQISNEKSSREKLVEASELAFKLSTGFNIDLGVGPPDYSFKRLHLTQEPILAREYIHSLLEKNCLQFPKKTSPMIMTFSKSA